MSVLLLMTYLQLTDARRSLTKVGICVADRRGGNSDQAQQIPQLTHRAIAKDGLAVRHWSLAPVPDDHHGFDRADPFWVKIPSWMGKT
jgi:hypothetical protein